MHVLYAHSMNITNITIPIPCYHDALGALTQVNVVKPSLHIMPVIDDGSKTIYCAFEKEASCLIHPFSHCHYTSHPLLVSRRMENPPKAILPKPSYSYALCNRLGH